MACKCNTQKPDLEVKPGIKYGEAGLTLVSIQAADPYPVIGTVTGYRYPFHQRSSIYVDARDAIYLLGTDFLIAE